MRPQQGYESAAGHEVRNRPIDRRTATSIGTGALLACTLIGFQSHRIEAERIDEVPYFALHFYKDDQSQLAEGHQGNSQPSAGKPTATPEAMDKLVGLLHGGDAVRCPDKAGDESKYVIKLDPAHPDTSPLICLNFATVHVVRDENGVAGGIEMELVAPVQDKVAVDLVKTYEQDKPADGKEARCRKAVKRMRGFVLDLFGKTNIYDPSKEDVPLRMVLSGTQPSATCDDPPLTPGHA